jgi:hypothetical protein
MTTENAKIVSDDPRVAEAILESNLINLATKLYNSRWTQSWVCHENALMEECMAQAKKMLGR